MPEALQRQTLEGGTVRLATKRCSFIIQPVSPAVLKITIQGRDAGEFGPAVFNEIRFHLGSERVELFVDAAEAAGPTTAVSDAWTRFLNREAPHLKRVSILAVSKFVHLTVSVAKLFSRTGELIQVYSDPELFRAALSRATGPR
ncbi:MAG TPA: hypothetical protein VE981_13975 [Planctomycetota bacterium]|nr:hypothetical protein [Planctomycetota bacterium]